MKTIKIVFFALACLVLTTNFAMAVEPEKQKIEKEKIQLLKKIKRSVSSTSFADFMKEGITEQVVVRCTVNKNNRVVVSKVIGFDDELKKAIRENMNSKLIKASSDLVGQELALHFTFKMK